MPVIFVKNERVSMTLYAPYLLTCAGPQPSAAVTIRPCSCAVLLLRYGTKVARAGGDEIMQIARGIFLRQ